VAPRLHDRFGLTWHPALAATILAHAEHLDIVEVIPEGTFLESRKARRALRTLAQEIPVAIHGVSLGLSSVEGVEPRRLDAFARTTWRSSAPAASISDTSRRPRARRSPSKPPPRTSTARAGMSAATRSPRTSRRSSTRPAARDRKRRGCRRSSMRRRATSCSTCTIW
jgi:hypothetical protein